MTFLFTIEALSLKLCILGDPSFRSQLRSFPFVGVLLCLGTLTMFHKISFGLIQSVYSFLFRSYIIFFNTKSNNQILDAHFLSFVFEVILKIFPSWGWFLNYSCHLESYAKKHSLSMYLM